MRLLYNKAKDAKVGDKINCPNCRKQIVKNTYNKVFCSNRKTAGRINCKDYFWNRVNPEKRCRDTEYFRNVIEPARIENDEDEHPFSSDALGQYK